MAGVRFDPFPPFLRPATQSSAKRESKKIGFFFRFALHARVSRFAVCSTNLPVQQATLKEPSRYVAYFVFQNWSNSSALHHFPRKSGGHKQTTLYFVPKLERPIYCKILFEAQSWLQFLVIPSTWLMKNTSTGLKLPGSKSKLEWRHGVILSGSGIWVTLMHQSIPAVLILPPPPPRALDFFF